MIHWSAFTKIIEGVIARLFNVDALEVGVWVRFKNPPKFQTEILGARNDIEETFERIEVSVIEDVEQFALRECVEVGKVRNHPGYLIYRPRKRHLRDIIMTMPERVVAFAKNFAVTLRRQRVDMQSMRSGKTIPAIEVRDGPHPVSP
jgi:hypothetical protein